MDRVIVLDGEEYLICREFEIEGIRYIYAVSVDNDNYTLLTEYKKNGESVVKSVEDQTIIDKISSELL